MRTWKSATVVLVAIVGSCSSGVNSVQTAAPSSTQTVAETASVPPSPQLAGPIAEMMPGERPDGPDSHIDVSQSADQRLAEPIAVGEGDSLILELSGLETGEKVWASLCREPVALDRRVIKGQCGPILTFGSETANHNGVAWFRLNVPGVVETVTGPLDCRTEPCSWVPVFSSRHGQVDHRSRAAVPLELQD